jgi:hypothetical protein
MNSDSDPFPPTMATMDSPHIFDTDMADNMQEGGLFFDAALPTDSPSFFVDDGMTSPFQSPMPVKSRKIHAGSQGIRDGTALSTSPESSVQDDSSDTSSKHKRKTSSRSSESAPLAKSVAPVGSERRTWGIQTRKQEQPHDLLNPQSFGNYDFSNRAMEHDFDFESAASSPSPAMSGNSATYNAPRHVAISYKESPKSASAPLKAVSRSSTVSTLGYTSVRPCTDHDAVQGTRETSPLSSVMNNGFQSMTNTQSQTSPDSSHEDYVDGAMLNGMEHLTPYQSQPMHHFPDAFPMANPRPALFAAQGVPQAFPVKLPSALFVHPTPHKSRVETQIGIKISLFPMPQGVTKIHLPAYTISKPKLLAKPIPTRSKDTLELYTMLVCTSAMRDPVKLRKALARAAMSNGPNIRKEQRRSSDGDTKSDDESLPLNGGEVNICDGCIVRERKRAARKKSKKPEEEEPWQKEEAKRIIVFNTNEIKEWQDPGPRSESHGETAAAKRDKVMNIPDGAQQVDLPMRIACYCRHQNEKLGFQVIFTVKDWKDNVLAQAMTNPIVITDDHKTPAPPPAPAPASMFADHQQLPGGSMYGREPLENYGGGLYRNAHSTTDLQGLQNNFNPQFAMQAMAPFAVPQPTSQATSTTLTPRNLSRQASPSASGNTIHKKRKASGGSIKVPGNLQMTQMSRLDTTATTPQGQHWPSNAAPTMSPNSGSPFAPQFPNMNASRHGSQRSANFYSGPTTPNNESPFFNQANRSQSFENLASMQQMFPASQSSHPSRAPSPTSGAQAMNAATMQMQHGLPMTAFSPTMSMGAVTQRPPTIHKLIPSEGPKAGGIEVTCLGSGFRQGLEIMFGDSLATTTTYWGETSLVCLLPPAIQAGTVPVTFKHQYQQQRAQLARYTSPPISKHQAVFKYIDDDEQELFRQAVAMVHQKMYNCIADGGEMARNILNMTGANSAQAGWSNGSRGGEQHRQATTGATADNESMVLRCLDMIDQDESPYPARLNMRRRNGQGLLHLAATLGYTRLAAGLVARGASPDLRDRNGFSPMHMAAMHGHAQIVRKLRLAGADPALRSLRGFTPADMATTEAVFEALEVVPHTRSRSAIVSRQNSSTSLASLARTTSYAEYDVTDSSEESEDNLPAISRTLSRGQRTPAQQWARSRRNSAAVEQNATVPQLEAHNGFLSPAAAMTAWRDQIAAQIQHFHQSVNWTLPNLQIPTLPTMPNLPDYQAYPMVRRFSALTQRNPSTAGSDAGSDHKDKEGWWDRLTGSSPPPSYEEIFPKETQKDTDTKSTSAIRAATDAAADEKCAAAFDVSTEASSSVPRRPVRIGKTLSPEEYEELKLAHAKNLTKLRHDRNLWSVWVSCLLPHICVPCLLSKGAASARGYYSSLVQESS